MSASTWATFAQTVEILNRLGAINPATAGTDTVFGYLKKINDYVDQVEGYTDQIEGYVDAVESRLGVYGDNIGSGQTSIYGIITGTYNSASQSETYGSSINGKLGASTDASGTSTVFARLALISAYVDALETDVTTIKGYVDTLETLIGTASPASGGTTTLFNYLKQVNDYVDTLETKIGTASDTSAIASVFGKIALVKDYVDTLETEVGTVKGYVDTLETLVGTANPATSGTDTLFKYHKKTDDAVVGIDTKIGANTDAAGTSTLFAHLARIYGAIDQVEGYTDGIETAIGANTDAAGTSTVFARLAQISGYVDAIESTLGTNADASGTSTVFAMLKQINSYVDQVEGYVDGIESLIGAASPASGSTTTLFGYLKTISDYVDGIEAKTNLIGATADVSGTGSIFAYLKRLEGFVDGIETKTNLIGATADAAGTSTIFARLAQIAGYVDNLEGYIGTASDPAGSTSVFARLAQIVDYVDEMPLLMEYLFHINLNLGETIDAANPTGSVNAKVKDVREIIGSANPTTGNTSTVMNYLKKIDGSVGSIDKLYNSMISSITDEWEADSPELSLSNMSLTDGVAALSTLHSNKVSYYPINTGLVIRGAAAVNFKGKVWVTTGLGSDGYVTSSLYCFSDINNYSSISISSLPWKARHGATLTVFQNKLWLIGGWHYTSGLNEALKDVWCSEDGRVWSKATDLPEARSYHIATVIGDRLFVMGGNGSQASSKVFYTEDGLSWKEVVNSEFNKSGMGSFKFGEYTYVYGGVAAGGSQYYSNFYRTKDGIVWENHTVYSTTGWSIGAYSACGVVNDTICILGGTIDSYGKPTIWISKDAINWECLSNKALNEGKYDNNNSGRWYHCVAPTPDGSSLMSIGGYFGNSTMDGHIYIISPGDNNRFKMKTKSAPWSTRWGHVALHFNNKLWVIGGYENGSTNKNDVWWSADGGATWTQATASAAFSARRGMAGCVHNGAMYIHGGFDSTYKNDLWMSTDGVTWTQKHASAGTVRWKHAMVSHGGALYIIGGTTSSPVTSIYKSVDDGANWTSVYSSLSYAEGVAAVSHNGYIYITGGYNGSTVNNAVIRSFDGSSWANVATTSYTARYSHQMVSYDGKMWVISGQNGYGSGTELCDIWCSVDGIRWAPYYPLGGFTDRIMFAATASSAGMYVLGGQEYRGGNYYTTNDVWEFTMDPVVRLVHPNTADTNKQYAGALAYNNELWLIAGGTPSYTNSVHSSADGVTWTTKTAAAAFSARQYMGACVHNGAMWISGGYSGGRLNDVWTSTDGITWTRKTAGAQWAARYNHKMISFAGKLWVIGGNTDSGRSKEVWHSTDGITWTQAPNGIPSARENFGLAEFGGSLVIVGGQGSNGNGLSDVLSSPDGLTWTTVTNSAPWNPTYDLPMAVVGSYLVRGPSWNDDGIWVTEDNLNWVRVLDGVGRGHTVYGRSMVYHNNILYMYGGQGHYYSGASITWVYDTTVYSVDINQIALKQGSVISPWVAKDATTKWDVMKYSSPSTFGATVTFQAVDEDDTVLASSTYLSQISLADVVESKIRLKVLVSQNKISDYASIRKLLVRQIE